MDANEGVAAVETGGKRRSSASHLNFQIPPWPKKNTTHLGGVLFLAEKEGFELR
jgi:hypothetical protein